MLFEISVLPSTSKTRTQSIRSPSVGGMLMSVVISDIWQTNLSFAVISDARFRPRSRLGF